MRRLGDSTYEGFLTDVLASIRSALHAEFKCDPYDHDHLFDYSLFQVLLSEVGDPETEVPSWLRHGCPTGICESIIQSCDILRHLPKDGGRVRGDLAASLGTRGGCATRAGGAVRLIRFGRVKLSVC